MAPFPAALSALPNLFQRGSDDAQSHARDTLAPTITRPLANLVKRQSAATVTVTVTAVPTSGGGGGGTNLSGGAIAGIVIGSVVGVLLLLWIVRSCMNIGAPPQERESWYHDVEPVATTTRRRHSGNHHHHGNHRSHSRRGSMAEVRTSSRPPVVVVRDDTRAPSKSPRRPSATYAYEEPNRGRSGRRVYESY